MNELINATYTNSNVSLLCYGKKITDSFRRSPLRLDNEIFGTSDIFADLSYRNAASITEEIIEQFLAKSLIK